jgi:hypothetical protein
MITEKIIYKGQPEGFWDLFACRLYEAWNSIPVKSRRQYLPYDVFRSKICKSFQINHVFALERLKVLQEFGLIRISKRGVILNFEVRKDE